MGEVFLRLLAAAAVVSAVLAAVLFPARPWLERYAPQVRWWLWKGLAALLLLAVGWAAAGPVLPGAVVVEVPAPVVGLPVHTRTAVLWEHEAVPGESAPAASLPPVTAPVQAPAAVPGGVEVSVAEAPVEEVPVRGVDLWALAGAVWLAVAAALILGQGTRYVLARRRLMRASVPAEGHDEELGKARLRALPALEAPMALGYARPVVFLPEGGAAPMAVRHELEHICRGDIWAKTMVFLACALYWFDPLVWYMARVADRDMEAACDAQVVRGLSPAERRSYGELLLAAAAGGAGVPLSTRFGGSKEQMKGRLKALFRPGKTSRALVSAVLALALVCAGLVSCRQASALADGTYHATVGTEVRGGKADFQLVEFAPEADWVGSAYETVSLPVDREVKKALDAHESGEGVDVARLEVTGGRVTALDWYPGMEAVSGTLWRGREHGDLPVVLRLPESWTGQYQAEGSGTVTDFYQTEARQEEDRAKGLLMSLVITPKESFQELYGDKDLEGMYESGGPWIKVLYEGSDVIYAQIDPAALPETPEDEVEERYLTMARDAMAELGPEALAFVGPSGYVSPAEWGFSLAVPESWQGHFTALLDMEKGSVGFWYMAPGTTFEAVTFDAPLLSLSVEAQAREDLLDGDVTFLGERGGRYFYAELPQAREEALTDPVQAARYRRMYADGAAWSEDGAWKPIWAEVQAAPVDLEARRAYAATLRAMLEDGTLPNGDRMSDSEREAAEENVFAVLDVDGDGTEELVVRFLSTITAGQRSWILDHDGQEVRLLYEGCGELAFFPSGALMEYGTHNQTQGDPWPYGLYRREEDGSYAPVAEVHALSLRVCELTGTPYPHEVDVSGAGSVFYIGGDGHDGATPVDEADYLAWLEGYTGGEALKMTEVALTEANIAAMMGQEVPGPVSQVGGSPLVPLAELEEEFGISDYYEGFTFSEVEDEGGLNWYRLKQEDGPYVLYVDGTETYMRAVMTDRGYDREVTITDLPWFLPSYLGSEQVDIEVEDITGDGTDDLIVRVSGGGTGAHGEYCRVVDARMGNVYAPSDLGGGPVLEELLNWVDVKVHSVEPAAGWDGGEALCEVSLLDGAPQFGTARVTVGDLESCDAAVTGGAGYFGFQEEDDALWAYACFNIASGDLNAYLGTVWAPLELDRGAWELRPVREEARLELFGPAQGAGGAYWTEIEDQGGKKVERIYWRDYKAGLEFLRLTDIEPHTPLDQLPAALREALVPDEAPWSQESVGVWRWYTAPGLRLLTSKVADEVLAEWAEDEEEYAAERGREYVCSIKVTGGGYASGAGFRIGDTLEACAEKGYQLIEGQNVSQVGLAGICITVKDGKIAEMQYSDGGRQVGKYFW